MSTDLELLESLEDGPIHLRACENKSDYHSLYVRGLVCGGFNAAQDRFDVAITNAGKEELERLRPAGVPAPLVGNLHMLLLRLGYIQPGLVFRELAGALHHAHDKFPEFACSADEAFRILGEEFGEVAKALNEKDFAGAVKELAQVNAVTVRFIAFLMERGL